MERMGSKVGGFIKDLIQFIKEIHHRIGGKPKELNNLIQATQRA